jgi:hypothetical protein
MAGAKLKASKGALAGARDAYPGWAIWISSAGRYWATRRGKIKIPRTKTHTRWAMTIDADSIAELENLINEQEDY